MGNIGTERREVEFEPLTQPAAPAPASQPAKEPAGAPAHEPAGVPADDVDGAPAQG